jgi:hypothetical protein
MQHGRNGQGMALQHQEMTSLNSASLLAGTNAEPMQMLVKRCSKTELTYFCLLWGKASTAAFSPFHLTQKLLFHPALWSSQ